MHFSSVARPDLRLVSPCLRLLVFPEAFAASVLFSFPLLIELKFTDYHYHCTQHPHINKASNIKKAGFARQTQTGTKTVQLEL